jgi:hypothetical protein
MRRLRYILDHRLVPGLDIAQAVKEAGRPRRFADDAGFGIACAAFLLQVGIQRRVVRHALRDLLRIKLRDKQGAYEIAIVSIFRCQFPAKVQFGDGTNIRLIVEDLQYDTGWTQPNTQAKLIATYKPHALVELDLGLIRDMVLGK